MVDLPPVNRTLLAVLDNQVARTGAALDGVRDDVLAAAPGGDCNSILAIGRHLVALRRFQLSLLESPLAPQVADPAPVETLDALLRALDDATRLVRQAVETHDAADWFRTPQPPREGRWGDEATIHRFLRPFNDFTNHLGAIRAIRRILGNPVDRTQ